MTGHPNVLWIVLDAARRDALEPYGAPAGSSPALAQLARRGSVLPHAYATGCWTAPSHTSMFTGLLPRAAGLGDPGRGRLDACRPVLEGHADRLLPEVLRRAGYATRAASANLWVSERGGFATGFDRFVSIDSGRQAGLRAAGLRNRARLAVEAVRARVDDGAREVERVLLRWVEEPRREPFFWFVNLVEAHSPYAPPRPYNDLSPLERLRAARDARRYLTLGSIWRVCAGGFDVPEEALARMRHLYRRSIRYMDDWLARVLEALDGRRLLEETVVIVTSDHGENLGEGGLIAHGLSLDNRLIHVPLIVAGPGARAVPEPLSLASLPRLTAEAAGLARHPWSEDDLPRGVGVAQLDPPAQPDDPRARELVESWGLGEAALARLTTALTCATDGRLKLVRRGEREELYDLDRDPLEVSPAPVGDGRDGAIAALRAALAHPGVAGPVAEPPGRAPAAEPPGGPPSPTEAELEDIEARMRQLGYM